MRTLLLLLLILVSHGWSNAQTGEVDGAGPAASGNAPARFFKPFGKSFAVSSAAYWGGVAMDAVSTQQGLRRGYFEANPLARKQGVSWAVSGGVYALTLWLERKHPRAAYWVRVAVGGVRLGVGARNFAVIR